MTTDDAAALLDLIVDQAPRLRTAGVLSVTLGDTRFELAPVADAPSDNTGDEEDHDPPKSVLHDPWTHGTPKPGGPSSVTLKRRPV